MQNHDSQERISRRRGPAIKLLIYWNILVICAWLIGPFLLARTWGWNAGWRHLIVLIVGLLAHQVYVRKKNPQLRKVRRQIGRGTPSWDIAWNFLHWPFLASIALIGGYDYGAHGSTLSAVVWPIGAIIILAGITLSASAMAVNPHFEGTVRVQKEREHRVIVIGPYRVIRHPGYLALALWSCGTPFILCSSRALIPAVLYIAWVGIRTGLEDAFLQKNLEGYVEFARNTRYRWLPGIW